MNAIVTRPKTLYICYFGLIEPLVQTQVLPYLRQLTAELDVSLLTFEPDKRSRWSKADEKKASDSLLQEGIEWFSLAYHKRLSLPAKLLDIAMGTIKACRLVRAKKIEVVHARSHVAAAIGALVKWKTGCRLIFDIRGLLADEYVDAGHWPRGGLLYRLTKAAERRLIASADAFVVLTERARELLFARENRPVEVIPCCVDRQRFEADSSLAASELRVDLELGAKRVLVYVGGLEGFYMPEELAELFTVALRDRGFTPLILSHGDPSQLVARFGQLGVSPDEYRIIRADPGDVPAYLALADAGVSFVKPRFSKLASSPTKVAEYLSSGLPVLSNTGIGDLDRQLPDVGVLLSEFTRPAFLAALDELKKLMGREEIRLRCRRRARALFDLNEVGGTRYRSLYRRLLANIPSRTVHEIDLAP